MLDVLQRVSPIVSHLEIPACNLWRAFAEAKAQHNYGLAYNVAIIGVESNLLRSNNKHAGIWQRAMVNLLLDQGRNDAALCAAQRSLEMQPDAYERGLSHIAISCALAHFQDRQREALKHLDRAERILSDFPDDVYAWSHLNGTRGWILWRNANHKAALSSLVRAARQLQVSRQYKRSAFYWNNAAAVLVDASLYQRSMQYGHLALRLLDREPHEHTKAMVYDTLGQACFGSGDPFNLRRAGKFFKLAASTFIRVNKREAAATLLRLSGVYIKTRNFDLARQVLEDVSVINAELKDGHTETQITQRLIEIAALQA